MRFQPWLSVTNLNNHLTLWTHKVSFQNCSSTIDETAPPVITFLGKQQKSLYLARLCGGIKPLVWHGQVRINSSSMIFLDCELSINTSDAFKPKSEGCSAQEVSWHYHDSESATAFGEDIVSRILTPLSNVICLFASDYGGLLGVAQFIARQSLMPKAHSLPLLALPRILVVLDATSDTFDSVSTLQSLRSQITRAMRKVKQYSHVDGPAIELDAHFRTLDVLGMPHHDSLRKQSLLLRDQLATLSQEVQWGRRTSHYAFTIKHLDAISGGLVRHFCSSKSSFDFIRESRPKGFSHEQFKFHLDETLGLLPGSGWLWRIIIPVVSSALCLANYPPGSHSRMKLEVMIDQKAN